MRNLATFFTPRSVAIVGASSDPERIGGRPLRYMIDAGFKGNLYPVNVSGAPEIQGLRAYRNILDIPAEVDQAIIVVPLAGLEASVRDCLKKGIKSLLVFTSGLAEVDAAGAELQRKLVAMCREANARMLGPNSLGLFNPSIGLYSTFGTVFWGMQPKAGVIGVATQSGAFGACAYGMATLRGLGLSRVVATGNEADIDVAECIAYMAGDPDTRVICAGIEGCRDGQALREALLKAADAGKPVIMMKVGASELGAAAAATHTGSLAGNDAVFDTVFEECGAYRARTIEEMLDVAYFCAITGQLPQNDATAIMTTSGGIGVLMADEATRLGLSLPPISPRACASLKTLLPFATPANPFDSTAQVTAVPDGMTRAMEAMLEDSVYGTVYIYLSALGMSPIRFEPVGKALKALRQRHPKCCFVVLMLSLPEVARELERDGIVVFEDPSRALRAQAGAVRISEIHRNLHEVPRALANEDARVLVPVAGEHGAKSLLAAAGIPVPTEYLCTTAAAALEAAESIGYPVVAKVASAEIAHKTEIGGVLLSLDSAEAVRKAYEVLHSRTAEHAPNAHVDGILIAPMIRGGIETIIGAHNDPVFGPIMMFGLGGTAVELFKDVVFASAPLTPQRAERMVQSVRANEMLSGWRGKPATDMKVLIDTLCRVSEFAFTHAGQMQDIDINPFIVQSQGGWCLDALITWRDQTGENISNVLPKTAPQQTPQCPQKSPPLT